MTGLSDVAPIGPRLTVPANASRFMATAEEARAEPTATLQLAWNRDDPFLFNAAFDPSLIRHDGAYCTTVVDLGGVTQTPTLDYFAERIGPHVRGGRVIDIGCGRGEFVMALRDRGFDAIGYDPVLAEDGGHLRSRYWTPDDETASVFVMRCVLPHIPHPWDWTRAMGQAHPEGLLLVEYQRLEWMVEHGIWYQLCHDHVNQFTAADFHARFDVIDEGTFRAGEWGWALVRPSSYRDPAAADFMVDLAPLWASREAATSMDRPVVPWGAAGKGIVLTHALIEAGMEVPFAIDADPNRQGRFMEVSGVEVRAPADGISSLPTDAQVLVCNPNHRAAVMSALGWSVTSKRRNANRVSAFT